MHQAILRGRPFPLYKIQFLIVLIRLGIIKLNVAIIIAFCLVITRLQQQIKVKKRLPSIGRSQTSTSPLGRYYYYYNIYLLLYSIILINLLLYFLLLPCPLINKESVKRIINQLVFIYYASTNIKTTLLIKLSLQRRFIIA